MKKVWYTNSKRERLDESINQLPNQRYNFWRVSSFCTCKELFLAKIAYISSLNTLLNKLCLQSFHQEIADDVWYFWDRSETRKQRLHLLSEPGTKSLLYHIPDPFVFFSEKGILWWSKVVPILRKKFRTVWPVGVYQFRTLVHLCTRAQTSTRSVIEAILYIIHNGFNRLGQPDYLPTMSRV